MIENLIETAHEQWAEEGAIPLDTAVKLMGEGLIVEQLEMQWEDERER